MYCKKYVFHDVENNEYREASPLGVSPCQPSLSSAPGSNLHEKTEARESRI